MTLIQQFTTGCKIWRLYFYKLWRLLVVNRSMTRCMLRKPTKSFRLVMRFSVESVDANRYWIRKPYMRKAVPDAK